MAKMNIKIPVMVFLFSLAPARLLADESAWSATLTAHFQLHRENAVTRSCGADMEKVFMGLRRELRFLSDWADRTKVDVYLYSDKESYLAGMFGPPEWSDGTVRNANPRGAAWSLALYEPFSAKIFAHQLSHLYTASFFQRTPENLPFWLNEGVAAMMEKEIAGPSQPSYKGPKIANPISLDEFFSRTGNSDTSSGGAFYAQAHSIVRFLKKGNSPFKFQKFCKALSDGEELDRALYSAYSFSGLEQFDKAWKKWRSPAKPGNK